MVSTCPSSYVSPSLPPSLPPSSTPSPTFLAFAAAAAAANDGTHVRDPSRTRRTMCVPYQPVGSRAHAALRTTPYSIPIPPTQPATTAIPPAPLPPAPLAPFLCTPLQPLRRPFVQPAMQPPQEATLIISIFPIRSGGRETCNTLPSARSLHTPLSFSPCSPRSSGSSTTHEASPSSRLPLLPPGSQPKEKYLYLSVSSRDTAPLPLPSTLFYPRLLLLRNPSSASSIPSLAFFFFLSFFLGFFLSWFLSFFLSFHSTTTTTTTLQVSRSLPPLSRSLATFPSIHRFTVSLPRFLSSFRLPSPYLHPTTPFFLRRCGGRDRYTAGASESGLGREEERVRG